METGIRDYDGDGVIGGGVVGGGDEEVHTGGHEGGGGERDDEDGQEDGHEGEDEDGHGDGDGEDDGEDVGHVRGGGPDEDRSWVVQVTSTVWGGEGGDSIEMAALPAAGSRATVISSVTLCPAWSVPASLLRLTCDDGALADQVTGPPAAVSVSAPV